MREKGIVPFSAFTSAGVVLLGLLGLGLAVNDWFGDFAGEYQRLLELGIACHSSRCLGNLEREALLDVFSLVGRVFVLVPVLAIVLILASGFWQTRFFFRWSLVGFHWERLGNFSLPGLERVFGRLLWRFCVAGVALLVGFGLVINSSGVIFLPLEQGGDILGWAKSVSNRLVPLVGGGVAALVLLALLFNRLAFRYQHRMTREELDRELREEE